ncbi:unnamed protein product [Didymodactylos carnosus]|uniref:TLC domain-containing protein n=1 Tax=Didymodactylos carnosus TaxID=1234261 RepID=A0A814A3S1_9BILA|nr:unnamed protein product [Didymodactylos carnosus]CAF0907203.1 unnamed protein product [Didymodactylos carnosus]CAF3543875.1 unnamed protein product [Didymodactylos carnosus]CAF3688811.1 unnamed protein product [Didymodactylos carnosus]
MAPPAGLKKKSGVKNPPIFSQEYLIQNHGDIACGILMVIALGTVVHITSPYCTAFFGPRHNVTTNDPSSGSKITQMLFNYGYKDLAVLFSYTLVCITGHAIVQEYVLDKIAKKLHLSKTKNSKFYESGQLLLFYVISVLWSLMIMNDEGYFKSGLSYLWIDYPYVGMTLMTKLYFLIQISYWLHNFPELYLQKIRKEDIPKRIVYTSLYLIVILYGYLTRFWRITLVLLNIHYLIEIFFHCSRMIYFYSNHKQTTTIKHAKHTFTLWNIIFVFGRLISVVIAWLTFWFGLKTNSIPKIKFASTTVTSGGNENVIISNFNTSTVRMLTLFSMVMIQLWLMWNFINFHLRRRREQRALIQSTTNSSNKSKNKNKNLVKKQVETTRDESDDLDADNRDVKLLSSSTGTGGLKKTS